MAQLQDLQLGYNCRVCGPLPVFPMQVCACPHHHMHACCNLCCLLLICVAACTSATSCTLQHACFLCLSGPQKGEYIRFLRIEHAQDMAPPGCWSTPGCGFGTCSYAALLAWYPCSDCVQVCAVHMCSAAINATNCAGAAYRCQTC